MKTAKRERELWVVPFSEYSCGGYYMAEKFPKVGPNGVGFIKNGVEYTDGMCFWLLSGRMEVLSEHQVKQGIDIFRQRGEIITEVWADSLPEGSRWLNL